MGSLGPMVSDALRNLRKLARNVAPALVLSLAFIGIWEALIRSGVVGRFTLPPLSEVVTALVFLPQQEFFREAVLVTSQEALLGFVIASAAGFIIGVLTGTIQVFRRLVHPAMVVFQNLPKPALAPLFVVWLGYGMSSKIATAAAIAFFPVLMNTIMGLESIPDNMRMLSRSYGASWWQRLRLIGLPYSLSPIFAGLKTAVSLALVGAIIAEFVGAEEGLGRLIHGFNFQLRLDLAFATLFYLAVLGFVLYAVVDAVDRRVVFWRGKEE